MLALELARHVQIKLTRLPLDPVKNVFFDFGGLLSTKAWPTGSEGTHFQKNIQAQRALQRELSISRWIV